MSATVRARLTDPECRRVARLSVEGRPCRRMRAVVDDRAPVKGAASGNFAIICKEVFEGAHGHRQAEMFLEMLFLSFVSLSPVA